MTTFAVVAGFVVLLGGVALVKGRGAGGDDGSIPGTASGWDITAAMSRTAMWLSTIQTRPRTRVWPWSNPAELGMRIGVTSWWGWLKRGVFASFEAIMLILGPPGTGKSGLIADKLDKWPGAGVSTSTSVDVFSNTVETRREMGPIWVFNPERVGVVGDGSENDPVPNMYFPLVEGCEVPSEAIQRAGYLISGSSSENLSDSSWWDGHAHRTLYAFLMAAALDGQGPLTVATWIANLSNSRPLTILENHPDAPPLWAGHVARWVNAKADKMAETVGAALAPVAEFLAEPELAACVTPGPGRVAFNAEKLIRENGTLYIIATDRGIGPLRPLTSALTGHVHETALRLGAAKRLDPPMLEALDEAALTCRVPLQQWTSNARKHGISILIGLQNAHQLTAVWGEDEGNVIWGNSTVKVVFGSIDDKDTLETLSKLGGDRIGQLNDKHERVPVLAPDRIKRMPDFHASVFYRNRRPVAPVRVDMVWEQKRKPRKEQDAPEPAQSQPEGVVSLAERRRRAA